MTDADHNPDDVAQRLKQAERIAATLHRANDELAGFLSKLGSLATLLIRSNHVLEQCHAHAADAAARTDDDVERLREAAADVEAARNELRTERTDDDDDRN